MKELTTGISHHLSSTLDPISCFANNLQFSNSSLALFSDNLPRQTPSRNHRSFPRKKGVCFATVSVKYLKTSYT